MAGPQAGWKGATPFPRTAQEQEAVARQDIPGVFLPDKTACSGADEGGGLTLPTWGWRRVGPEMEEVSTPLMGKEGRERQ